MEVKHEKIKQIAAGYQISYVLTEGGEVIAWGNENLNDVRLTRRNGNSHIAKISVANTTLMALTDDGEIRHLEARNPISPIFRKTLKSERYRDNLRCLCGIVRGWLS